MGKTRELFKKIRDTKRTFHAKMGTIMDRNGMDLTEAEDIKNRWQEHTEIYTKHYPTLYTQQFQIAAAAAAKALQLCLTL